MMEVPYTGTKKGSVYLDQNALKALLENGRLHINIGSWKDGTPAFLVLIKDVDK